MKKIIQMKSEYKPTHSLNLKGVEVSDVDNSRKQGEKCWCLHCERIYDWGDYIELDGLQQCPYEGCDGDTVVDSWSWSQIREANPDYPEKPEYDKAYPMYPEPQIRKVFR